MDTMNNEHDDTTSTNDLGLIGETSRLCPTCNKQVYYSYRYDALFSIKCNEWLEENCGDPYCEFCSNRPSRPLNKT